MTAAVRIVDFGWLYIHSPILGSAPAGVPPNRSKTATVSRPFLAFHVIVNSRPFLMDERVLVGVLSDPAENSLRLTRLHELQPLRRLGDRQPVFAVEAGARPDDFPASDPRILSPQKTAGDYCQQYR
jgi:hypothetical protein